MSDYSLELRFGVSLVLGLAWSNAALGEGLPFPGARYAAGKWSQSIAIGDLEGDHVPDPAVASWDSVNVSVLPSFGDGASSACVFDDTGPWPRARFRTSDCSTAHILPRRRLS